MASKWSGREHCRVALGVWIVLGVVVASAQDCLIISEVVDGNRLGGYPKFVEITNTGGTPYTFAQGGIIVQSNSSTDRIVDANMAGVTISPGGHYVVACNASDGQLAFTSTYGFEADRYSANVNGNGDDRYILTDRSDGSHLLDIFGQIDTPGGGTAWEYTDGYAYRLSSVNAGNGGVFDPNEWVVAKGALIGANDAANKALLLQYTTPKRHVYASVCGGAIVGACCRGPTCSVETPAVCTATGGGVYQGDNTTCVTNTCGAPVGACCTATLCAIYTPQYCWEHYGTYLGDGTTCLPSPCIGDSTIAQAKAGGTGKAVRLKDVVVSSLTDLVGSPAEMSFQLQDATGGITVRGENAVIQTLETHFAAGDKITLEGLMTSLNGLSELVAPLALITNSGPVGVPTPAVVTAVDFADGSVTAEGLESRLVCVECAAFAATGSFAADTCYPVTDAAGSFTVCVAAGLNLVGTPIPVGSVNLTGIFLQDDPNAPFDGGYRLMPRKLADVMIGAGCGDPTGACCTGAACAVVTQGACQSGGGQFAGAGTTCTPNPCCCRGDANCDGQISYADINPFVAALANAANACSQANCDVNGDDVISYADINPFVVKLGNPGPCP
jgi:hypothetical protein